MAWLKVTLSNMTRSFRLLDTGEVSCKRKTSARTDARLVFGFVCWFNCEFSILEFWPGVHFRGGLLVTIGYPLPFCEQNIWVRDEIFVFFSLLSLQLPHLNCYAYIR